MLEVIEVQTGGYLGEDDIVRFDDTYGRCGPGRTLADAVQVPVLVQVPVSGSSDVSTLSVASSAGSAGSGASAALHATVAH
jgi:mannose-1-phosphate guanylyltransferase/mannose-6-phosphate isomerase